MDESGGRVKKEEEESWGEVRGKGESGDRGLKKERGGWGRGLGEGGRVTKKEDILT